MLSERHRPGKLKRRGEAAESCRKALSAGLTCDISAGPLAEPGGGGSALRRAVREAGGKSPQAARSVRAGQPGSRAGRGGVAEGRLAARGAELLWLHARACGGRRASLGRWAALTACGRPSGRPVLAEAGPLGPASPAASHRLGPRPPGPLPGGAGGGRSVMG